MGSIIGVAVVLSINPALQDAVYVEIGGIGRIYIASHARFTSAEMYTACAQEWIAGAATAAPLDDDGCAMGDGFYVQPSVIDEVARCGRSGDWFYTASVHEAADGSAHCPCFFLVHDGTIVALAAPCRDFAEEPEES